MPRNFGITSGIASGGQPQPRSHIVPDTQHDNVIQLVQPHPPGGSGLNSTGRLTAASSFFLNDPVRAVLESSEVSEAAVDERETATCFFLLACLCAVCGFLLLSYYGLQSFVTQPVEYHRGVKAD